MENKDPPKGCDHGKPPTGKGKQRLRTSKPNVFVIIPGDSDATTSDSNSDSRDQSSFEDCLQIEQREREKLRKEEEWEREQWRIFEEKEREEEERLEQRKLELERKNQEHEERKREALKRCLQAIFGDSDNDDFLYTQAGSEPSVNQNENTNVAEKGEVEQPVQPKPNDEVEKQVQPNESPKGSFQGSNDV